LRDRQTAGVDCRIDKHHDKGNTGTCLVMLTPDAERTLCTFLGIDAALSEHDIESEVIAATEYVYFEAHMLMSPTSFATAIRLCEIAEQKGAKIALSFSDPGVVTDFRDSLCKILTKPIDLLFCNRHEAFSWAQPDNMEIAVDSLKKIAHTFAITFGAGDMFAGAFLFSITQGKDFLTAGNLANFAAATVVSNYGARLTAMKQQQILL